MMYLYLLLSSFILEILIKIKNHKNLPSYSLHLCLYLLHYGKKNQYLYINKNLINFNAIIIVASGLRTLKS